MSTRVDIQDFDSKVEEVSLTISSVNKIELKRRLIQRKLVVVFKAPIEQLCIRLKNCPSGLLQVFVTNSPPPSGTVFVIRLLYAHRSEMNIPNKADLAATPESFVAPVKWFGNTREMWARNEMRI